MKTTEWRRTRFGKWALVDVDECVVLGWVETLRLVTRATRNQRNFGRHMNTTMRYW